MSRRSRSKRKSPRRSDLMAIAKGRAVRTPFFARVVSQLLETEIALAFLRGRIFGRKTGCHPRLRGGGHFPENALERDWANSDRCEPNSNFFRTANTHIGVVPAKTGISALTRVFDALWRPQRRDTHHLVGRGEQMGRHGRARRAAVSRLTTNLDLGGRPPNRRHHRSTAADPDAENG